MDVMLAAFRMIKDYPGGAVALAPVVGKTAATLSHEVSPNYPTAKFGLADAVALSQWTNDRQVLTAFAAELSCMVVPLPADVPGVEGVAPRTAQLAREFSDLMTELATSLADGHVSTNELGRIEREGSELMAALQSLLGTVRALHDAHSQQADEVAHVRLATGGGRG